MIFSIWWQSSGCPCYASLRHLFGDYTHYNSSLVAVWSFQETKANNWNLIVPKWKVEQTSCRVFCQPKHAALCCSSPAQPPGCKTKELTKITSSPTHILGLSAFVLLWELVNDFHLTSDRRNRTYLCDSYFCFIYLCMCCICGFT